MRPYFAIIASIVLSALWLGPLPELAQSSFSAHMALHMGVVAVASAFVALSLAGGWFDPAARWPAIFSPVPASVVELIVVWTWHAPALHHFARSSTLGLMLEQGTFALAGTWLWISALGGRGGVAIRVSARMERSHVLARIKRSRSVADTGRSLRRRRAAGVAGLLLTSMHMTLLGALLALTPRPLYPHPGGMASLTPLEDQHLGGAIMLLVGGAAYLIGGLWLTASMLRSNGEPKTPPSSHGHQESSSKLIPPEPEASSSNVPAPEPPPSSSKVPALGPGASSSKMPAAEPATSSPSRRAQGEDTV